MKAMSRFFDSPVGKFLDCAASAIWMWFLCWAASIAQGRADLDDRTFFMMNLLGWLGYVGWLLFTGLAFLILLHILILAVTDGLRSVLRSEDGSP